MLDTSSPQPKYSDVPDVIEDIKQEMLSCVKYARSDTYTNHGIYAITDCKDRTTECFDKNDPNDIENIVFVTDDRNITYRNSKCAQCNGVSSYSYWLASFLMEDLLVCAGMNDGGNHFRLPIDEKTAEEPMLMLEHGCTIDMYPPPGKSVRFCIHGKKDVENCSTKFSPVKFENAVFLNEECCYQQTTGNCSKQTAECVSWRLTDGFLSPWHDMEDRGEIGLLPSSVLFRFTGVCIDKIRHLVSPLVCRGP